MVVDSSALMAIVQGEPAGRDCENALAEAAIRVISAGTLAETLLVADRRGCGPAMRGLITGLGLQVVPVDAEEAFRVADAHARWGRGVHPAGLNFGDCFAYALARHRGLPLLYVGDDFGRADVRSALK